MGKVDLAGKTLGTFTVFYGDLPAEPAAGQVEGVLNAVATDVMKFLKGPKIASQDKLTLEGNPGLEVKIVFGNPPNFEAFRKRAYLVKNRVFLLEAPEKADAPLSADTKAFFNSFHLPPK